MINTFKKKQGKALYSRFQISYIIIEQVTELDVFKNIESNNKSLHTKTIPIEEVISGSISKIVL